VTAQRRAECRARDVLADLAQELRAQLVAVRGRVGTAEGTPEMQRMTRLVDDLVQLARLEAGRDPGEARTHDLSALLREACAALGAAETTCRLAVGETLAPVRVDATRTRRALDLLLARAARAAPDSPIEVALARRDSRVECTISDPPTPSEELGRSSGTFRQGCGAAALDLYLAQRLVETQGGELTFEKRGVRSFLRVSFPAAPSAAPAGARPGAGADPLLDEPDEEFLAEGTSRD
jgi:signal transduction histidine kinase